MDEDLSTPRWLIFFFVFIVVAGGMLRAYIILRHVGAELR
jgi:hypothetical protein